MKLTKKDRIINRILFASLLILTIGIGVIFGISLGYELFDKVFAGFYTGWLFGLLVTGIVWSCGGFKEL